MRLLSQSEASIQKRTSIVKFARSPCTDLPGQVANRQSETRWPTSCRSVFSSSRRGACPWRGGARTPISSYNFVGGAAEPLALTSASCDQSRLHRIGDGLKIESSNMLYSMHGGSPSYPSHGDIKVVYKYVPEGTYTVVSQWNHDGYTSTVDPAPSGILTPYDDDVKEGEFAAQGEIGPGDKAKKLARRAGYESFVIPEWLIDMAEQMVLSMAPIRVAWVQRGVFGKEDAFDKIEEQLENDERGTPAALYV